MAVRLGARGCLMRDDAGSPWHVLDDHRLPDLSRDAVGQETRHDVRRRARSGRYDEPDRSIRPRLGRCRGSQSQGETADCEQAKNRHAMSSSVTI
jgi:hypothetical protein